MKNTIYNNATVMSESVSEYKLTKVKSDFQRVLITSPKDGANFIRQFYSDDIGIFESSFILLLDRSNHTIGYAKISQGGIVGTVVDVRLIAKYAIDSLGLCNFWSGSSITLYFCRRSSYS